MGNHGDYPVAIYHRLCAATTHDPAVQGSFTERLDSSLVNKRTGGTVSATRSTNPPLSQLSAAPVFQLNCPWEQDIVLKVNVLV